MDTLKARLRLSGTAQTDGLAQIDEAVERARIGFYERLGSSVISTINATGYVENGTTDAQLARARAFSTEVLWVKMILLDTMPILVMDSSAANPQTWNEEGLLRGSGASERAKMVLALKSEIESNLSFLSGDGSNPSSLNVSTIGPLITPARPGESVFG